MKFKDTTVQKGTGRVADIHRQRWYLDVITVMALCYSVLQQYVGSAYQEGWSTLERPSKVIGMTSGTISGHMHTLWGCDKV
jgi:hypothetical protein